MAERSVKPNLKQMHSQKQRQMPIHIMVIMVDNMHGQDIMDMDSNVPAGDVAVSVKLMQMPIMVMVVMVATTVVMDVELLVIGVVAALTVDAPFTVILVENVPL